MLMYLSTPVNENPAADVPADASRERIVDASKSSELIEYFQAHK
jgi:hypothetical protein